MPWTPIVPLLWYEILCPCVATGGQQTNYWTPLERKPRSVHQPVRTGTSRHEGVTSPVGTGRTRRDTSETDQIDANAQQGTTTRRRERREEQVIVQGPIKKPQLDEMSHRGGGSGLLNRHQVGGVSRSPDGLFVQQERKPIRGRPAVRGKGTYGVRPGQCVEEQGTWASRTQKHSEAGYGRPVDRGVWAAKTVKRRWQQPAQPAIRQLLGATDAQTAHPATSSTATAHQPLGSANVETTPAGAPATEADRKQRPDATCKGKNG